MKRLAVLCLLLAGCCSHPSHSHTGAHSDASSSERYAFPEFNGVGFCQSPINISSRSQVGHDHEVYLDYLPAAKRITNTGHTVRLDVDEGSTITLDGKVYEFRQFHFHTPSEHQIDGVTYPMEMHLVHTLRGDEERYLVIGLLFKEGEESKFLASFLSDVPETPEGEFVRKDETVDVRDLADGSFHYYSYQGSLTTPPYSETVFWAVHANVREASRAQIQRLNALEGNNARHVQPLHGRDVEEH